MEPPDLGSLNVTTDAPPLFPLCAQWRPGAEGSVFHLGHILLLLGFMGGSGAFGLLHLFSLLTLGFLCASVWAWEFDCNRQAVLWTLALFVTCLAQLVRVCRRVRRLSFDRNFTELYNRMFKRLGVSRTDFEHVVSCVDSEVQTLSEGQVLAAEGKTPIDCLSVLLSGRVSVSINGEFLHHIHPFQFLDSPEWDSLMPSEEGLFQVTLQADESCRYVSWRRKKLYLLFSKHRYIARIFALIVRSDIADKVYSLSDKASDKSGHRLDLRLPSYCYMPAPELESVHELLQVPGQGERNASITPSPSPSPKEKGFKHTES